MLSRQNALDAVRALQDGPRAAEKARLDRIAAALVSSGSSVNIPRGAAAEMRTFARISQTNYLPLILDVMSQGLCADGYRDPESGNDVAAWGTWQRNGMDARQTGVHRSALAYGVSYVTVLPGDSGAVLRGVSARRMTAAYADAVDDDWPMMALRQDSSDTFRLYDEEAVYYFGRELSGMSFIESRAHGLGVCPVVRFRDRMLLDNEAMGVIEPLIPIQHRIDETVFGLLTAQHFSAFRQRYLVGWTPEDDTERLQAAASRLWTFSDPDVKPGEFDQTALGGYLDSKDSAVKDMAAISQTPPQALLGAMANLSAEALAATEAGKDRKVAEIETSLGESWEQALRLAGAIEGNPVTASAQLHWRDSTARSLAQTVDALGKMVQMLGVPAQALWSSIPGTTQQDVEEWKATAAATDTLGNLTSLLDAQAQTFGSGDNAGR